MKTTIRKNLLLATAAVAVLGLGAISKPAQAFDEVNWAWNKVVTEDVTKNVLVDIIVAPTGMVELEKIQFLIGDVTASSSVTDINNIPPGDTPEAGPTPEPGPQLITLDLKAHYADNKWSWDPSAIEWLELKENTTEGVELTGDFEGTVDEKREKIWLTFDLTVPGIEPAPAPGPQPIPIGERLAIDLPKVASNATAVGNNQDIASSASVELHDSQFLVGDISTTNGSLDGLFDPDGAGNTHIQALSALISGVADGTVTSATVSADSSVSTILNAFVDSKATAVANNMSIDMEAFTPSDAFMIGDVTQFAYADVLATSTVSDITIEGYSDLGTAGMGPCGGCELGDPQIPLVNSVATAVGNNLSIKVSSPDGNGGVF